MLAVRQGMHPSRDIAGIRTRLREIASSETADLAEGALWIAAEEYPALDVADYLEFVDEIAASTAARLAAAADPETARAALCAEIFGRRGFDGDREDYYDPRNSYLNDVIDRRRGIPITLAIVYLAAARRIGQAATGLNAPGHFLVRHGDAIIDAYHGGRILSRADFVARIAAAGVRVPERVADSLLASPPSNREILTRMLGNLKAIHLRLRDMPRALAAVDRLVDLNPDQPHWLRERGAIYQQLECTHAAIADLERFCELVPDDPERDVVRKALVHLMRTAPAVH